MLLIMGISAVSLLIAATAFIVTDNINTRQSTEEGLLGMAKFIASSSIAAILLRDRSAASETLEFLQHQEHIRAAALYGPDGDVFAAYVKPGADDTLPAPGLRSGNILYRGNYVEMSTPIMHEGGQIGHVYLRSDISRVQQRLSGYLGIVVVVLAFSLLIAYLLSVRLQRFITDPMLQLSATARQVTTDRNYSLRATRGGADELGNLVLDFNEMLDQIHIRDNELEITRRELEERVASRTMELETANRKLAAAKEQAELVAKRMEYHAHHDALTGIPNRILLSDRIDTALSHARRNQSLAALLFLDLDRFKVINDSLGHVVGDQLLRVVSRRLKDCLREEDTVARLGGDEFMVLLPGISSSSDAGRIGNKIIDALSRPASCNGHDLHVTASIGVSIYPFDGVDSETLLKNADISMYRAKELGRNKLVYYTAEMNAESRRLLALETNLRKALEREELKLVYQPIIDVSGNAIVGVEALLRWEHPAMGMVSPADFIPIAEESGLIAPIGKWVISSAFRQLAEWHAGGHRDLRLAVNLSAAQLARPGLVESVMETLAEAGLDASSVELEITENGVMRNIDTVSATLEFLKGVGFSITMDDFGTGYSALSCLRRLPLDRVKIDHSFVRDIPDNREDVSIAQAIIAMTHSLGLALVAEGVENIKQLNFFRKQEVFLVQGYLFSEPVSARQMHDMLEAETAPGPFNLVRT